jgi:hypothetical protein
VTIAIMPSVRTIEKQIQAIPGDNRKTNTNDNYTGAILVLVLVCCGAVSFFMSFADCRLHNRTNLPVETTGT